MVECEPVRHGHSPGGRVLLQDDDMSALIDMTPGCGCAFVYIEGVREAALARFRCKA